MRYLVKKKLLTMSDVYTIKDRRDRELFVVKGRVLSLSDKLSFQDWDGQDLAIICQKGAASQPTYQIYRADRLVARVRQSPTPLGPEFKVTVRGARSLEVTGNFWKRDYCFRRGREPVAWVAKKRLSLGNVNKVDIARGVDEILILACVVAIDRIMRA